MYQQIILDKRIIEVFNVGTLKERYMGRLIEVEVTYRGGGYRVTFVRNDPRSAMVERFVAETADRNGKHRPAHYRSVKMGDVWYAVAEIAAGTLANRSHD
jgi:hypothetical protein